MKAKLFFLSALALASLAANAAEYEPTLNQVAVNDVKLRRRQGKLIVNFDLDLSDVKVKSNQQIIYTPQIVGQSDSIALDKIVINGRNVALKELREPARRVAGASQVIKYDKNASPRVSVSGEVPYQPWMELSQLKLSEDLCGCGVLQGQDSKVIGQFDNRPAPAPLTVFVVPEAEGTKAREESGSAFVDYVVNRTEIKPDYRRNRVEIAKIIATIDLVKNDPNVSITNINIHGYASPEGTYANNTRLAEGRAASLKDYVKSLYTLPEGVFTSNATPEDWQGLRRLVVDSDINNKAGILAIIDDTSLDPDERDHKIRREFPSEYAFMLKEWYPALRHSDYTVQYVVRPFTIEETREIMKRMPKQVSLNEMFLVAQTCQPGSDEFNDVMDIAVRTYPDSPVANLNAACAALGRDDLKAAAGFLAKSDNSAQAQLARAALAMKEGRLDDAQHFLDLAKQGGLPQADDNFKILERMRQLKQQNQ